MDSTTKTTTDTSPIRVSVVVPVYNAQKHLVQCLKSLVSQTLQDIEFVIVNDGSTDDSQKIIDRFAKEHPGRIRAFSKPNSGVADTRNYGIEHSRGEYIGFVDSDDFVDPSMFAKLYHKAAESDADVAVCHFNRYYSRKKITKNTLPNVYQFGASVRERHALLLSVSPYVWNKIIRRRLYVDHNIRFPSGKCFEDDAITYNMMLLANRIEIVPEALYNYRLSSSGTITSTFNRRFFDIFDACDSIASFFRAQGAYDTFRDEVEFLCTQHIYARISALRRCNDRKLIFEFVDAAFDYLDGNFPDWRNNRFTLARRLIALHQKPSDYLVARDDRDKLKAFFQQHIRTRRNKAIGLAFRRFQNRLLRLPRFVLRKGRGALRRLRRLKGRIVARIKKDAEPTAQQTAEATPNVAGAPAKAAAPATPAAAQDGAPIGDGTEEDESPQSDGDDEGEEVDDGTPYDEVLHKAQQYGLQIMEIVDRFCREHGLVYYLAEGTLLGAVRHKGFIPWDDDIDIAMPRADYDRLIALWGENQIENCILMHQSTFESHYMAFSKIILKGTDIENTIRICPPYFQGPSIDIFPLDNAIELHDEEHIAGFFGIRRCKRRMQVKSGFAKRPATILEFGREAARQSYEEIHREMTGLMTRYNDRETPYIANYASSYLITQEHFPREAFGTPVEAEFEGRRFYVPQDTNTVLGTIYNDYMTMPPVEKRSPKHGYRLIGKG